MGRQNSIILSLASEGEHVMLKHALIGCRVWHDWSSNIWSLADCGTNFRAQNSAHEMAERLDIEDLFREIDPDLCQYRIYLNKRRPQISAALN